MADLAVIGCGHVGMVTAACFAEMGHRVTCFDIDRERIAHLRAGRPPIHEPGLEPLLRSGIASDRLTFESDYPDRIEGEFIFIAVNTPSSQEGAADLRAVRNVIAAISNRLLPGAVIVDKSTVPIGTGELVHGMARRGGATAFAVVSNPEFLQEGSAIQNFMSPDRVVLGSDDRAAVDRLAKLYEPLGAPIQKCDTRTAEMIKYASNAFLATKVSFINEMAAICEALGADIEEVARGMGMDRRIGGQFLRAGLGWGGSCFPKDVRALAHTAAVHGTHPHLLRSVMDINDDQRRRSIQKLRSVLGDLERKRVLVLGAAFKPHTDDIRNSPALELADLLQLEGADVAIYDPAARASDISREKPYLRVVESVDEGAQGADALVLATEWPQFRELDFERVGARMANRVLIDSRNFLNSVRVRAAGFEYRCVGRPHVEGGPTGGAAAAERLVAAAVVAEEAPV